MLDKKINSLENTFIYTEAYLYRGLRNFLSKEVAKNVFWSWLSPLRGWGSLTMTFTGKFVYMAHHFISILLTLGLIGRDGGLNTLCHS